jgi:hypothetical protein
LEHFSEVSIKLLIKVKLKKSEKNTTRDPQFRIFMGDQRKDRVIDVTTDPNKSTLPADPAVQGNYSLQARVEITAGVDDFASVTH